MNVHKHARKAEWESLPFIVRPLRDWYIISLNWIKAETILQNGLIYSYLDISEPSSSSGDAINQMKK